MKKYLSSGIYIFTAFTFICYTFYFINPQWAFNIHTTLIFPFISDFLNLCSLKWTVIGWIFIFYTYFKFRSVQNAHISLFRWFKFIIEPFLWLITLYFWLWGFNYLSPAPEDFILGENREISSSELLESFQHHTNELNLLRDSLETYKITEDSILSHQKVLEWQNSIFTILKKHHYSSRHNIDLLQIRPTGLLLRIGTAGFYNFVLARPTIDPGLHPIQIPNTSLHEIAHSYGVASESSANFIAYVAGSESKDLSTQYSVKLSFWKTLKTACFQEDSTTTKLIASFINPLVKKDILSIRKRMEQYPDIFPQLRDNFYDLFLKSQGVEEGIYSYEMYLPLVLRWEKEKNNQINKK